MKKRDSKLTIISIGIIILFLGILFITLGIRSDKNDWIKDDRGVWIKHGYPSNTPQEVQEQQQVISQALELYNHAKADGMEFSSQCLGAVGDYAVDIVHVPRSDIDNRIENQCEAFRERQVSHFIELDKNGNIVKIV